MSLLKQGNTTQALVFLMVDAINHITGKTGLAPTVTLSKNGSAFNAPSGAVTELGSGWYVLAANASDASVLGPLILHATAAGADPVDTLFEVVAFDPSDGDDLGLDALESGTIVIAAPVVQAANKITLRAGDSWSIPINGLGDISLRTKLWFTVNAPGEPDDNAKLFIEETAGLTRVNGAAYVTPAHGSIIVSDASAGDIDVTVEEAVTLLLESSTSWAVKMLTTPGEAITLVTGNFMITKAAIHAIT